MSSAGHHSMMEKGAGGALMTCDLGNLSGNGININVNGLTNVSFGGWARNMDNYQRMPGWAETGGWGGTYFGPNEATIEVRFGTGSSQSKRQYSCTFPRDEWHHYFFTRNGSTFKFYLDGALIGTQTGNSTATKNNSTSFRLFTSPWGYSISEGTSTVGLCYFSRALSEQEVLAAKNQVVIDLTKAPFDSGCIMAINLTEGEGNVIHELVTGAEITTTSTPMWDIHAPETV